MTAFVIAVAAFTVGCAAGLLYVAHRCDRALNRLEDAEQDARDFAAWDEELNR